MAQFEAVVAAEVGLHARPAALFVQAVAASGCKVTLTKQLADGSVKTADGASILQVMSLGVACGESVQVEVVGEGETVVAEQLKALLLDPAH
jgi:phosphocarrier protein HPr